MTIESDGLVRKLPKHVHTWEIVHSYPYVYSVCKSCGKIGGKSYGFP
jgi:hypothetical protein